ncbi:dynein heavy chain 6, axonemal [Elysia marginata]|uniref:Dynein heavy chain 6, axonemal n=1 Tax=Elysia marginata TaxID=1093978 RepID=A0AAV4FBD8_9GAST|nr:dynein heavy chain 6, axonemal [Elysia marginata]
MHVLAVNSVSTLLNYLSDQLTNTPTLAEIQAYNSFKDDEGEEEEGAEKKEEKKEEKPEEEEEAKLPSLFITEFVLEPNQLLFSPDSDDFQDGVAEVIKRFQDAVLSVQNLVPDAFFDAFTRYIDHVIIIVPYGGSVAQWLARRTCDLAVAGSIHNLDACCSCSRKAIYPHFLHSTQLEN